MKLKRIVLIASLFFLFPCISINAQIDLSSVVDVRGSGTVFQLSPRVPGPNQDVRIVLENSDLNLDSALITWTVSGQVVKSGMGVKNIIVQTGNLGTQTTVKVSTVSGNAALSDTIILRPSEVDMLWQGRGYVPPFYKGRNLLGKEGYVTIMAIPHVYNSSGGEVSPANLIYRWSKNGEILGGASGASKNYLTFADSILATPQYVTVDIFEGNTISASNSIRIQAITPNVSVYENNPLYGFLFNNEVGNEFILNKEEITLAAFPYFFNPLQRISPFLKYEWSSNASRSTSKTSQVTYRADQKSQGFSTIRVSVKSTDFVLQSALKDLLVYFKNENVI